MSRSLDDAIRSMDRYNRDYLHNLCQEYLRSHSSSVLREIRDMLSNFGCDEDDPYEIEKVLR